MNILSVNNLQLSYGVHTVFSGATFGIAENERIALVGQNGAGKTTLLNLIASVIKPDDGEIVISSETTVGYLPQRVHFNHGETTHQLLERAVHRRKEAIEEYTQLSQQIATLHANTSNDEYERLLKRQTSLQHKIEHLGGWDYHHEINEMVDRLDLRDLLHKPIDTLSGGQRRRADLARALLSNDTLLLLDEPTNHLDTATVEWLEQWLLKHAKALLFVTHDRYFLERIATRILEIAGDGSIYDHPGNYSKYMERKVERIDIQKKTEDRRQNLLRRELAWLRQGIKARGTRSKYRLENYHQLVQEGPAYTPEKLLDITISDGKRLGAIVIEGYNLTKSFDGRMILDNANFVIVKDDCVGIIGPNGCGKTTLIKLLMEEIPLDAGTLQHGSRTKVAWLRQELPQLDPTKSLYDAFSDSDYVWIGEEKIHKSQYLKNFLFDVPLQRASTSTLSGGQRRRFELAKLVAQQANVIILDEPTNDLDLTSLQALEDALESFSGCIVAISHDRYFLNRICNRIIAFENGKLETYEGNYDDYRAKVAELQSVAKEQEDSSEKPLREKKGYSNASGETTSQEADKKGATRKLTYAERLKIPKLEKEMEKYEEEIDKIHATLADPDFYNNRTGELPALNKQLTELQSKYDAAFEEWGELVSIQEEEN